MNKKTKIIAIVVAAVCLIVAALAMPAFLFAQVVDDSVVVTEQTVEVEQETSASEPEPEVTVEEQPEPATVEVTLYLPDENVEYVVPTVVEVDAEADLAAALIDALIAHGSLPEDTAIDSWDAQTGALSLNEVYGTAVSSTGTAGEMMLIYTVVDTFLDNFALDQLTITILGEELATGHTIYDFAFTKMDLVAP